MRKPICPVPYRALMPACLPYSYILHQIARLILLVVLLLVSKIIFAQKLLVQQGAHLIMKGAPSLVLKNSGLQNSGNFVSGIGKLSLIGTGDSTIAYISGDSITHLNHLYIFQTGNGVTLRTPVYITDSLSVSQGTLYSNGKLTLRSGEAGTALVAALPVDGSGQATAGVNGKVTIERFIPARKAWRLLAAPVSTANAPTINQSWQEGATTASATVNPYPGYGTHITGGTTANGYDQGVTSNASLKIFNYTVNNWVGLPDATGTHTAISSYPGYFLYVRGDRGVNLQQGVNLTPANTTLRMKGELRMGSQSYTIEPSAFTVIGNPYAAPIDFSSIQKSNVSNQLYLWDPKMSGLYGLGAYVTLSWNENTLTYDATSSVSPVSQYIPSGEAFIVRASDNFTSGTLTIREEDKSVGGSDQVFGFTDPVDERVRVDLLRLHTDNTTQLLDGVLCTYADNHSNNVNGSDAKKISGSGEVLAIREAGQLLSIERHRSITAKDSLELHIAQMRLGRYVLNIDISNMNRAGMIAILKDKYAAETNNKILDLDGLNEVVFMITSDPLSYSTSRFHIEFEQATTVPVTFNTIRAYPVDQDVSVDWVITEDVNTREYEVERSADGLSFYRIGRLPARAAAGQQAYSFIDEQPVQATNYYRIISISQDGQTKTSAVVKVNMQKAVVDASINIFPNPVVSENFEVWFMNQASGVYTLKLISSAGAVVSTCSVQVSQARAVKKIQLDKSIAAGIYQLEIIKEAKRKETKTIVIQ